MARLKQRERLILTAIILALGLLALFGFVSAQSDSARLIQKELQRLYNILQKVAEKDLEEAVKYPFILLTPEQDIFISSGVVTLISQDTIALDVYGLSFSIDTTQADNKTNSSFYIGEVITVKGKWDRENKIVRAQSINYQRPRELNETGKILRELISLLKQRGLKIPEALKPYEND